jgi:hypothetical protein
MILKLKNILSLENSITKKRKERKKSSSPLSFFFFKVPSKKNEDELIEWGNSWREEKC